MKVREISFIAPTLRLLYCIRENAIAFVKPLFIYQIGFVKAFVENEF
ncbi:hypothetical protein H6F53_23605 [Trichocoleus sp. FACHB-832]|nr:hypothetical protein [Trichocoleus sp. FACHB-832]MBD1908435.1 hypothetical protein [Trichocoleus sp. FACHB-832]